MGAGESGVGTKGWVPERVEWGRRRGVRESGVGAKTGC